jgi:FHS family Na+ dependent glucose MFS transporter 1
MSVSQATGWRQNSALRKTFGYYAMFICLGLSTGMNGPLLPTLAQQTQTRLGQMGWLFLAGSIGFTLGTNFGGRVFDRRRGHPVLGVAQIFGAVITFCIPFLPWFWLLLLLSASKAFADGMINTGANTLLVWTHGGRSGPFMNALHFFFGLGAFVSPLIIAQVLDISGGYRWVYWALAVFALLVGLRMLTMPDSPTPLQHTTKEEKTAARLNYPLIAVGMLFLFFYVGSEITFGGWVYTYAVTLGLASQTGAAYLTSVFWFAFTAGRLLSIPLATRVASRTTITIALLGCLLTVGLLIGFPGSTGVLWTAAISLGFFMAPIWPTGFTLIGQSIQLTARASGIVLLGDSLGGMVLPWLVGQVLETLGVRVMVGLIFASLVGNLLMFGMILRLRKARQAGSEQVAAGQ